MLLLLLGACGASDPASWEECAALSGERAQNECWTATLPLLACTDPKQARAVAVEKVPQGADRDFILYTIVSKVEPEDASWCALIEAAPLKKRCQEVVQRPHLHPELTKGFCPGGATRAPGGPGGPPPGGAPPGGAPPGGPPPGGAPPGGAPASPPNAAAPPVDGTATP